MITFNPHTVAFRTNPYLIYEQLRSQDPVHYRLTNDDWILTRYADIVTVFKDNNFGHRNQANLPHDDIETGSLAVQSPLRFRQESQRLFKLWLSAQNPLTHTRLHKAIHRPFTPHLIRTLRLHVEQITNHLLDQLTDASTFDLIHDFAALLPKVTIATLLAIPAADYAYCWRLSSNLALLVDLDVKPINTERGSTNG